MKAVTESGREIECAEIEESAHGVDLYDAERNRVGYVPYDRLAYVAEIRTPVESSSLKSVGYDPDDETLEIEFHSGGVYRYRDVPRRVYQELLSASSHGSYFHEHVRGQYDYRRLR
ncbi:KTSC domain-containing protein [Halegenticoccus soli]|uniref:KTSC domain-containing protein n=1 Tax=Halegenticoccus soli TaxID=1985678 RepID=UPI000C6D08D9|nr:KTSC domain-containing protein [Halegenticoccus soli]